MIETQCELKGGDWEAEKPPRSAPKKRKTVKKKMNNFAKIEDVEKLWRSLTEDEKERAKNLLPIVEDSLRMEADKVGKNLDRMIEEKPYLENVAKSVVVDVVARTLMTSTDTEPMTQRSESALGYSVSGTYLVPGGGLFIKKSELARLGLKRQRIGVIDLYDDDKRDHSNAL